jgi:hypothetical protein
MTLARRLTIALLACVLVLAGAAACKKVEPTTEAATTLTAGSVEATASDEPVPTAEEIAAAGAEQDVFSNGDDTEVTAGAEGPTFPLVEPMKITAVVTLHVGQGMPGGTIALSDANGTTWGPWTAQIDLAPDGNTYWTCAPNVVLPVGEYTAVDSDPATWAKNDGSDGFGFVTVRGTVE